MLQAYDFSNSTQETVLVRSEPLTTFVFNHSVISEAYNRMYIQQHSSLCFGGDYCKLPFNI